MANVGEGGGRVQANICLDLEIFQLFKVGDHWGLLTEATGHSAVMHGL